MTAKDFFLYLSIIVLFVALVKCASDKRHSWLPPHAKLIRQLDSDWKLIEINGQKYQLNSDRRIFLPYTQ